MNLINFNNMPKNVTATNSVTCFDTLILLVYIELYILVTK